jgi:cyclopropane fatty-acyl-phospholipid synthase-like methyltransferase
MTIEELLTVENWIKNPSTIMRELIGDRELLNEYIVLQSLMNKTTKYSDKTWKREINQYDTIDLIEEIDKLTKPVSILDVGCGDGNVLGLLKEEFGRGIECYGISVMNHPHNLHQV